MFHEIQEFQKIKVEIGIFNYQRFRSKEENKSDWENIFSEKLSLLRSLYDK
jgi:hypothetical protein